MRAIDNSELILNPDGSIYHLNLLPEDIAEDVIFVGDPDRVSMVSQHFDQIEIKKQKREFVSHVGRYKNKRITVISTGIGTDNIDIVLNELDALVNIDLHTKRLKEQQTSLRIVRIGTSGCLDKNIPVDSTLLSTFGLGLDGLLNYYNYDSSAQENELLQAMGKTIFENTIGVKPYICQASQELLNHYAETTTHTGITASCTGFYGPQGRRLRLLPKLTSIFTELAQLNLNGKHVTNFEMETAAIYGLAQLLGHKALSINLLVANREQGTFSLNPKQRMNELIFWVLEKMVAAQS